MTARPVKVGLVIVSHSAAIASGVVELAAQMAATTRIVAAGGTDDGGIGTSFDRVLAAIGEADPGSEADPEASEGGVVVLCDLGSAVLTSEMALDFLDEDARARVRIADAPIVEGAIAAAVDAEGGGDLSTVLAAAESAAGAPRERAEVSDEGRSAAGIGDAGVTGTAVLRNEDGLHARPAAELVKLVGTFESAVRVNGVDGRSLLRIMSLGLTAGSEVSIEAEGPDAATAVDAILALVDSGFGET